MNRTTGREREEIEAALGLREPPLGRLARTIARFVLWTAIVAGAAYGAIATFGDRNGAGITYVTEPATRADLVVIVTATGTVQPTNKVEVSSELSGIVRRVLVDDNSVVRVGDVLAELDTDSWQATVEISRAKLVAARAEVGQAKATVEETRLALERKEALVKNQSGSQQDLDSAIAAHERAIAAQQGAEADIGVAEAQLRLDETNLEKAVIRSPISGIVLKRSVDPGQTVASSFQAPVLFSLAEDLSAMEVQVAVDEADVGRVREGLAAEFTVDAYPERRFQATIRQLRFGPDNIQGVVTYAAVLATENKDLLLRPGMTATAEIVVETIEDALTVSNAALRYQPPAPEDEASEHTLLDTILARMPDFRPATMPPTADGARTVWVLNDGAPLAVPVEIGATDGWRTEIVAGAIEADAAVIVDAMTAPE